MIILCRVTGLGEGKLGIQTSCDKFNKVGNESKLPKKKNIAYFIFHQQLPV